MRTRDSGRLSGAPRPRARERAHRFAAVRPRAWPRSLLVALCTLAACGGVPPAEEGTDVADARAPDDPSVAAAPAAPGTTREDAAAIFPEDGIRGLVLNNCASCHAVACAAIGQRDPARWDVVEASHQGRIPGLSIEDFGKIFDYLRRNFNETRPEPTVLPELLEGGCPPI